MGGGCNMYIPTAINAINAINTNPLKRRVKTRHLRHAVIHAVITLRLLMPYRPPLHRTLHLLRPERCHEFPSVRLLGA
jgi:hypothetical protein